MTRITAEEKRAMALVKDGADVIAHHVAGLLRSVQKKAPKLITITSVMGVYDGAGRLPYFGAILTPAGKALVATKAKKKVRRVPN